MYVIFPSERLLYGSGRAGLKKKGETHIEEHSVKRIIQELKIGTSKASVMCWNTLQRIAR